MNLLLPKPQADRNRWQQALAQSGHNLLWVDPWTFEVFEETAEQRTHWLNLDLFSGVICVSPVAARLLGLALDRYWPMPPVGVQWWCNGPGTASELLATGLKPRFPDQGNTAESVLAILGRCSLHGQKWLIVKGEGGRERYPAALSELGAEVTELCLYRRQISAQALPELIQQSAHAQAILIGSVTLLDAMMSAHPEYWRSWPGVWLYTSERLQQCGKAWALSSGKQINGASPQALLAAL